MTLMTWSWLSMSLQKPFHGDFLAWLELATYDWNLCSWLRHVEGLHREAGHKEAWKEIVEGKRDMSSFRTCTK